MRGAPLYTFLWGRGSSLWCDPSCRLQRARCTLASVEEERDWLQVRPGKINAADVERLGRLRCTQREAAAFFDVRHHEFTAALEDPKIRAAWDRGQSMALVSLRRDQFRLAGQAPAMAIFLGKNLLGQRDVTTVEGGEDASFDATRLSQKQRDALRSIISAGTKSRSDDDST